MTFEAPGDKILEEVKGKRSEIVSQLKRVDLLTRFAECCHDPNQARTEALVLARAIALAGLPKRGTPLQRLSRTLRLGTNLWLRVSYGVSDEGNQLPYGQDRFVLAGIQHLAIENQSPIVFFDRVGKLLEMFGISQDGRSLARLRERFRRLAGLTIALRFAENEAGLQEAGLGENIFVIENFRLPTRRDLRAEKDGQLALPLVDPELSKGRYGVRLSDKFWRHLQETKNHLIVPIDLLRVFIDQPLGWDYFMFLAARCGACRTESVIPHEVLMGLFKDAPSEPDRLTVFRLKKYHELIMTATSGRLKASFEEIRVIRKGRGRPAKRWGLRVQPSAPIVFPGQPHRYLKMETQ